MALSLRVWAILLIAAGAMLPIAGFAQANLPDCAPGYGRIVSMQGKVEIQRAGAGPWYPVTRLDTTICGRDIVSTGPRSRAAVIVAPETVVRVDQSSALMLILDGSYIQVEMFTDKQVNRNQLGNTCGAGYFITRFPKKFKVFTPLLNAAVEGTEFQLALACDRADVSVFEGRVTAEAHQRQSNFVRLVSGQTATSSSADQLPTISAQLRPRDAVQWALYYPPVSELDPGEEPQDCTNTQGRENLICMLRKAEASLRVGRVDAAREQIDAARALGPQSPEALALLSIVSLVKDDKTAALKQAEEAVSLTDQSSYAWLALSYARQAHFDLEGALSAAQSAAKMAPTSALARGRVAELLLSLGDHRGAEKAALEGVVLDSRTSRPHTALGFVRLAQLNARAAKEDFLRALILDSTDPLPRLGIGLAEIRMGNLEQGREHLEIAVALDPLNSLIRSYAGKAYFEENTPARDALATAQFALAKSLDPLDPTPNFYDAILKLNQNRPVDALHEMQASVEKNDNRAIYRSKLFIDSDHASRSANLARIHQDLGFSWLSLTEAYDSVRVDAGSFEAHRFLADSYATIPRHDIARVSEALQAQLRQPLDAPPLQPELADDRAASPRLSNIRGLAGSGAQEWDRLFQRDGVALRVDGGAGSVATTLDQEVFSIRSGRVVANVSRFGYETDGFGTNARGRKELYDGFIQFQLAPGASLQVEARKLRSTRGDDRLTFDPNFAISLRLNEEVTNYRAGFRYEFSPRSEFLTSFSYQTKNATNFLVDTEPTFAFLSHWSLTEIQHVLRAQSVQIVSGLARFSGRDRTDDGSVDREVDHNLAYVYALASAPDRSASVTMGASRDNLNSVNLRRDQTNPKIGLAWRPHPATSIKAAWFRSLKRQLVANQTIEPTSVEGFNQFFDDPTGSDIKTGALRVDHRVGRDVYLGLEGRRRSLHVPALLETSFDEYGWHERLARTYGYWALGGDHSGHSTRMWSGGLSVELHKETIDRDENITGIEGIRHLEITRLPFVVSAHHSGGLSVRLQFTKVWEDGQLLAFPGADPIAHVEDRFITDLDVAFRLPRRQGTLMLGVRNLFDQENTLTELDPVVRVFAPSRFVFARLSLQF